MDLAQRIRETRQQKGLSQEALAERMEVSRQAVTKWETGKACPSTEKLLRLSQVLEVPLDALTGPEALPRHRAKAGKLPWVLLVLTVLLGIGTAVTWVCLPPPLPDNVIGYADAPTRIYVTGAPMLLIFLGVLTGVSVLVTLVAFLCSKRGGRE